MFVRSHSHKIDVNKHRGWSHPDNEAPFGGKGNTSLHLPRFIFRESETISHQKLFQFPVVLITAWFIPDGQF